MCVWSAYAGKKEAAPLLLEALKKTEGYWAGYYTGIAVCSSSKEINFAKCVGHTGVWEERFNVADLPGNTGIAHSRTNSGGDDNFAHPYVGTEGIVALVSQGSVGIFGEEKPLRKKFMSIKTDSKGMEEPKDPDTCNVFQLYKLFATPEQQEEMRARYIAGNYGYGHAKQALFEAYMDYFAPMRKRREELVNNMDYVDAILKRGAERAREEAMKTLTKVRELVGIV